MTFYNVISGILFLAACKALLHLLGTPAAWTAAVLVVTILNESVLTSELIERKQEPVPYTLGMKWIDFLTFAVFSWALLVLAPGSNVFDVNVTDTLPGAGEPWAFWLLLSVYWLLLLLWNQVAGQRDASKWESWFYYAMHVMWLWPVIALAANWRATDFSSQAQWTVYLNLAAVAAYFISKMWAPKQA